MTSRFTEVVFNNNSDVCTDSNVVDEQVCSVLNVETINENITPEIVKLLEQDLSDYEKVALVFLLHDVELALQTLKNAFASGISQATVISDWVMLQEQNWRIKLLEALVVIQNYEVINKMGFIKNDVQLYFPIYSKANTQGCEYVDSIKKKLYIISENLSLTEAKDLISLFEKEIRKGKNTVFESLWGITENKFLEICFLHMFICDFICNNDECIRLRGLIKLLKQMDKLDLAEELKKTEREVVAERLKHSEYFQNIVEDQVENQTPEQSVDCAKYPILNPNRLGMCIIINQVIFKNDPSNPRFELDKRLGSEEDVVALKRTFKTNLKMDCVEFCNLRSHEILQKIKDTVDRNFDINHHSMLFVCIMSHGKKGCIYGTDSKPVDIKSLEDCIADCEKLHDKPKVLIVQACQHEVTKEKVNIDDITTDGPLNRADFVTCMATLEGLKSIRNKRSGTWYIQSLCENIDKYKDIKHFADIVTEVHGDIKRKGFDIRSNSDLTMIPSYTTSLTSSLYFYK